MSEFIVPAVAPRIRHLASGPEEARRVFSFPFPAVNAADIAVHRDGTLLDGGYVIAFAEDRQGGSVTFDAAVPEGVEIVILRSTVIERATDFVENGAFRASALNLELDRLTMIAQELDLAGRAGLHRDPTEIGPDLVLPAPPARANRLLGFSSDGRGLAVLPVESLRGERGETGPQGPAGDMSGVNNLSELTDTAMARANLDAPSRMELEEGFAAVDAAIRQVDLNLALNTLHDAIDAGWTTLAMVDGFADEFEDQSGVSIPETDVTSSGTASASSVFSGSYPASNALTGTPSGWASNYAVAGSWWQITFPSAKKVSRIDVAISNNGTLYADIKPQYYNGSSWIDLAAAVTTTGVVSAPYSFTFDPVEATQFRLLYSAGTNGVAYLTRAWFFEGAASGLSSGQIYDADGDFYELTEEIRPQRTLATTTGAGWTGMLSVDTESRIPNGATVIGIEANPEVAATGWQAFIVEKVGSLYEIRASFGSFDTPFGSTWTLVSSSYTIPISGNFYSCVQCPISAPRYVVKAGAQSGAQTVPFSATAFNPLNGDGPSVNVIPSRPVIANSPAALVSNAAAADTSPAAARAVLLVELIIGLSASINVLTGGTASGSVSGAGSVVANFPFLTDGLVSWVEGTALDFRYDLGDGNAVRFRSYEVQVNGEGSGRYPTGWQIYGSNDGTAWTLVDTVSGESGWSDGAARTYIVDDQTTAWRHFRFLLTGYVGAMAQIRNLQLFPVQEPDPTDVIALNTDLICEVSRDDGESWTALALSREVTFESGLELLAGAETSLEMQPAGTAMRIRLKTPTSRRIRVKGWAMQWR